MTTLNIHQAHNLISLSEKQVYTFSYYNLTVTMIVHLATESWFIRGVISSYRIFHCS